ncbi:hypothetical protein [Streptomyces nymphaeiformis]|uniref:Uncharacterized protein n=1 Tax=Streptomyces nymphaeiformis TaxID=2663842 RepID=A0A7W7XE67_9ACTN|nr:hypothetical protein [Streptomyces nymphaeiformis]MBB4984782.1 hypothetical protein [Streptomyces nymphaeiformis]
MSEGGEVPRPTPGAEQAISNVRAELAQSANPPEEPSFSPAPEGNQPLRAHEDLTQEAESHRDRFERMLALSVDGQRQEIRTNEDGSKTVVRFIEKPLYDQDDRRQLLKLREAAALAGVKEAFAPLVIPGTTGDPVVHLGYEETISRDSLPGRLQDPPYAHPDHDGTRDTPL